MSEVLTSPGPGPRLLSTGGGWGVGGLGPLLPLWPPFYVTRGEPCLGGQ